jgi:arylsulfatase A-like enzyme
MKRLLAFLLLLTATTFAAEKQTKALYIGIDGTRFDAIEKAETPNLDKLMKEGIYADNCLILGDRYQKNDTISGPGWSSILCGVWADKHGVHDHTFKGRNYEKYPHFFALLKQQKPNARTASFVTWEPIDKFISPEASDVHQFWEDKTKDYAKFDTSATDAAIKELANPKLDCLFLYLGQVDVAGHTKGFHPTVPQYIACIENCDKHVGEAVAAMKKRETYEDEDWLVVVTSDHGGKGTNHGSGHKVPEILNSFLIVSGDSAQRGKFTEQTYLVDAPVTVLKHLGVKIDEKWELDGKPRGLK